MLFILNINHASHLPNTTYFLSKSKKIYAQKKHLCIQTKLKDFFLVTSQ